MMKNHPFVSLHAKESYQELTKNYEVKWPDSSTNLMVPTSFGETHVRVCGPKTGEPLVLLPGALSCSLTWLPNIFELSRDYRIYAVDTLINTGNVGRSRYNKAITDSGNAVLWLEELINGLGLSETHITGMSYGGLLACYYAMEHPERLKKMILLAPAILPIHWKFIARAISAMIRPSYESYRKFLNWHLNLQEMQAQQRVVMEGYVDLLATARQCYENIDYLNPVALKKEEMQRIKTPTYLLVGSEDRSYPIGKSVERLQKWVPHWKLEILPGVGHGLPMVEPGMVNHRILQFLSNEKLKSAAWRAAP